MAQSSNYKQYARTTRALTEETGFAGGMLWTGNHIDATHLKAIVNYDYDDTTGFLKSRDPFIPIEDEVITAGANLSDKRLIGVYNISAEVDDTYAPAGLLYIFGVTTYRDYVWHTKTGPNDVVAVFKDAVGDYHQVVWGITSDSDVGIKNTYLRDSFILYDNQLYALCDESLSPDNWLHVFKLVYSSNTYTLYPIPYSSTSPAVSTIRSRFDAITLLEAYQTGWNAARGTRMFTYDPVETTYYQIDGASWYENGKPIVNPRMGVSSTLRVVTHFKSADKTTANAGTVALFRQNDDTSESATVWELIARKSLPETTVKGRYDFEVTLTTPNPVLMLVHYGSTAITTNPDPYADTAIDRQILTVSASVQNLDNLKLKTYNFSTCTGTCRWDNRLCLWGVESANNQLFISAVDNFYYFPVPSGVAVFDTNVISCIPYKDTLLVFTADKVYQLSVGNDGTITQSVIQNNMPLSLSDASQLVAIKNMILFKSGKYFYMIVPKAQSLTGELSIAPIYKSIAGLLNDLDAGVQELLQLLYPEYYFQSCEVLQDGNPVDIYAEQDTVHILYDVSASIRYAENGVWRDPETRSFAVSLNYNTNTRAWTMYLIDTTAETLEVATLHASRMMSFVRISRADAAQGKFNVVMQQHTTDMAYSYRSLIDTGYRMLSTAMKKRFRELQIKLFSEAENITAFGTAFLIDGVYRKNYMHLVEVSSTDNTYCLAPAMELDDLLNAFVTEPTMPVQDSGDIQLYPGSDRIELSDWTLDFSHFVRNAPSTVRIPVSGKGYTPRFILVAPATLNLSVNEINWVYRIMNGR